VETFVEALVEGFPLLAYVEKKRKAIV